MAVCYSQESGGDEARQSCPSLEVASWGCRIRCRKCVVGFGRNTVLLVVCMRICRLLSLQKGTISCSATPCYFLLLECNRW